MKLNKMNKFKNTKIGSFRCASSYSKKHPELVAVPEDTKESIHQKFNKIRSFQKEWFLKTTLQERIDKIVKYKGLIEKNEDSLALLLTKESGKPISQSHNEIKGMGGRFKFFIENSSKALENRVVRESPREEIRRMPLGVVANISAWNYPLFVGLNVIIPALISGNGLIYKPSEYVSRLGIELVDLLYESGFPQEIVSCVVGGKNISEEILNLDIDGLFFTGSLATGQKIQKKLIENGKYFIKTQFELGGKDPLYIHNDVDVKNTAAATADGAFYNTGQSCCSVERIYVHQDIFDEYVEEFVKEVNSFKIGDPLQKDTYIGPLTLPTQVAFLEDQVKDAVAKGAKVLTGGKRNPQLQDYFLPTVLVNVDHSMKVMREESFGPIIGIMKVEGPNEAQKLMDDNSYGLTSGVYSKDIQVFENIMKNIDFGTSYWNCCDRVSPFLPWIGRRNSGIGLTLSEEGITTFTYPRGFHIIQK